MDDESRYGYRVNLTEFSDTWTSRFHEISTRIAEELGDAVHRIEPMGSRLVPAMVAKPILDVMVTVSPENRPRAKAVFEAMGLRELTLDEADGRTFFRRRDADGNPDLHIHLVGEDDWELCPELIFYRRLRRHEDLARSYSHFKLLLAELTQGDVRRYGEAKDRFISCVTEVLDELEGPPPPG
ncbi:GrpB family protein [Rhizohabitans arisaemae]|uniref:GrpB family protein n=1 Tax=Rhizohabitans arisaemae TaxID=2720610 RepID=UPI0024B18295|nr:GrpB family protein [Rhizohabitans arisaemae]